MSGAIWVARVRVTDPAAYARYMALAPAAFAAHGARFLARGAPAQVLEGGAAESAPERIAAPEGGAPERIAVIAFDSVEAALACYHSPEYAAARAQRQGAAEVEITIMEGMLP